MFSIPDPLHPAVVHFPIVLILLGGMMAVVAVFLHRWHLPWVASGLLILGTTGAFVAVKTGESAQEIVGELPESVEQLLDEHEEWAERTEAVAAFAAIASVAAAILGMFVARRESNRGAETTVASPGRATAGLFTISRVASGFRMLTAVVALIACVFLYQTAHRGGKLVYNYGVGVKHHAATGPSPAKASIPEHDEDDH